MHASVMAVQSLLVFLLRSTSDVVLRRSVWLQHGGTDARRMRHGLKKKFKDAARSNGPLHVAATELRLRKASFPPVPSDSRTFFFSFLSDA